MFLAVQPIREADRSGRSRCLHAGKRSRVVHHIGGQQNLGSAPRLKITRGGIVESAKHRDPGKKQDIGAVPETMGRNRRLGRSDRSGRRGKSLRRGWPRGCSLAFRLPQKRQRPCPGQKNQGPPSDAPPEKHSCILPISPPRLSSERHAGGAPFRNFPPSAASPYNCEFHPSLTEESE
jgi:hypothetical protein